MTNEEAIITLTNILTDDYGCRLERRDYDSISHAIMVMENAEKCRWRYPQKNTDDLSLKTDKHILVYTKDGNGHFHVWNGEVANLCSKDIVAWAKIILETPYERRCLV